VITARSRPVCSSGNSATGSCDWISIHLAAYIVFSKWRGPGWIIVQGNSSEQFRPRQGKHTAEKDKPDVPNNHLKWHTLLQNPAFTVKVTSKIIHLENRIYLYDYVLHSGYHCA